MIHEKKKSKSSLFNRLAKMWLALSLCAALIVMNCSLIMTKYDVDGDNDLIIVLDPGHGGSDVGAINKSDGLYESAINLKIALACRDALQKYDGAKVYMTHTGVNRRSAKSVLRNRVDVAQEVGADIFISLHINSADNRSANGSEVYVPHTTYKPEYNENCTKLAEMILDNFKLIGLNSRGVKTRKSGGARSYKHSDGTKEQGDYYYVVGEPIRRLQIPGILVEHAFIDGDSKFLDSDEDLKLLGIADADAIAKYFGLTLKKEYMNDMTFAQAVADRTPSQNTEPNNNDNHFTSEEDTDNDILSLERMINALPENPPEKDFDAVDKAREAFDELGSGKQGLINADVYQKLCNAITVCENLRHPVRLAVKSGSDFAIDRVNSRLINVETAAYATGQITVFSILLELELYIDPSVAEFYSDETKFDYRVINTSDELLDYDSVVTNGSVISIYYDNQELDSLTISIVS